MGKQTYDPKEEERKAKQRARMQKHIVICPHCGKEVLDHMTECPFCKGELKPAGYRPPDENKMKKVRRISLIVGIVVALGIFLAIVLWK